ncbi:MAG: DUF3842 family protein [Clostridia bacterium]|nr:DUF3842 family protein [Clostridia bacterium]
MTILIVDGQGGRLGKQLVKEVLERFPGQEVLAVGTNSMATESMLKAGAPRAATGENAVVVACRKADIILGPMGMVIADALLGEVTPEMARAVGQSNATRILLPSDKCSTLVAGVGSQSMSALIGDAMDKLAQLLK